MRRLLSEPFKLDNDSRRFFCLALATALLTSVFDVLLSLYLTSDMSFEYLIIVSMIFVVRIIFSLITNYLVLSFSFSAEVHLKSSSISGPIQNMGQNFNTTSYSYAHNALTGALRIVCEVAILLVLSFFIFFANQTIFFVGAGWVLLCLVVLKLMNAFSRSAREKAATAQQKFLESGNSMIGIADRIKELKVDSFFSEKILRWSRKYRSSGRMSLFIAQSYKPVLELMLLLLALVLYWLELIGPELYLGYRIANSLNVIANIFPVALHYRDAYLATRSGE